MAPCQSRQLVICSLPFAVLVAFFWYRRRRSLSRSDPGGTLTPATLTVDNSTDLADKQELCADTPQDQELCVVNAAESPLKKEEVINKVPVVEEPTVVAECVKPVKSIPLKKEVQVEVKETTCVNTPVHTQDQLDSCNKAGKKDLNSSDFDDSSEIFHSTVIEDVPPKPEQSFTTAEEEKGNSENSVDIKESFESSSFVLESEDSAQNSDEKDTEVLNEVEDTSLAINNTQEEEGSIKKRDSISFEEQNSVGNLTSKKYKKAAKKAEKRSKRQEKSLKLSSLLFKTPEKTDQVSKEDSLSKSKDLGEVENTSSDSGIPSSEDSNNTMAQGQKTEEKTDNSAVGLEQKLASLGLDTVQSSTQRAERDSANHSPAEVMLNSPAISTYSDAHSEVVKWLSQCGPVSCRKSPKGSSDSGKGCSDVVTPPSRTPAGGSSVAGDQVPSIFEFVLPQVIVGRLIGRHGSFLQDIRGKTHTNVFIKRHPETNTLKICAIEGSQQDIDAALKMIRQKFPLRRFPELTLERVSFVKSSCLPINPENLQLHLVEGLNNDVILSSLISAGHFFLQLPSHLSYQSLYHLQSLMNTVYNTQESPCLHEPQPDVVCVAPTHGGGWYRAQILTVDKETDTSSVKFLDYGGYLTVENAALRQIRGDFLLLPFQAVECVLANVVPAGGEEEWSEEATKLVHQMTTQQTLQAQVYDYTETGQPLVYLYSTHFYCSPTDLGVLESKVVLLNQELVSHGFADLIDSLQEDEQNHELEAAVESS